MRNPEALGLRMLSFSNPPHMLYWAFKDLQASWEKVRRRIDELAQDPRAVAVDYILGG